MSEATDKAWPTQKGVTLDPEKEGLDYINVYSKAKTQLGKRLSHLTVYPTEHPRFGRFDTMEGFWYYLATGMVYERFRTMSGFEAKAAGKEAKSIPMPEFEDEIRYANCLKLYTHRHILNDLLDSTLPLVHFYCYRNHNGAVVRPANRSVWLMKFFEQIRESGGELLNTIMGEYHAKHHLAPLEPVPVRATATVR